MLSLYINIIKFELNTTTDIPHKLKTFCGGLCCCANSEVVFSKAVKMESPSLPFIFGAIRPLSDKSYWIIGEDLVTGETS